MDKNRKRDVGERLYELAAIVDFLGAACVGLCEREGGTFLDRTVMGMSLTFQWVGEQIEQIGQLTDKEGL